MKNPTNLFKKRLQAGQQQFGIWNSIFDPSVHEILALAGYDWILIDTEHSPVEVTGVLPALQAIAAYEKVSAIVRPAINDPVLIKRHLDQGAQTLMIPYVQSPQEAAAAVQAMRYPPAGIRGVAGATRASRYGTIKGYARDAEAELCLIVQVETTAALAQLREIALVPGVDAVFFGPADLAASMGFPGEPTNPAVIAAIHEGLDLLSELQKPAGILVTNPDVAKSFANRGVDFVGVGVDSVVLSKGIAELRSAFD